MSAVAPAREAVALPATLGRSAWKVVLVPQAPPTSRGMARGGDLDKVVWEDLAVARRRVRTLRIECQSWTRTSPTHRASQTVWYAPEAKRYIKLVSHYTGGPTLTCSAWSVRP